MNPKSVLKIFTHPTYSQLEVLFYSFQGDSHQYICLFICFRKKKKFTVNFSFCWGKNLCTFKGLETFSWYIVKLLCAVEKKKLCWELEKLGSGTVSKKSSV